jgi:hypothetical protein
MAKDPNSLARGFDAENTDGVLSGFLAEEDGFDRSTLWRLGSWAAASVGAVIIAVLANQTSIGMRREQIASVDLARQSQQIQSVAKETQSEARRLASAIETLNSDRDRLYSRVAILEQGLDSVTGAIARQNPTATPPQAASPAVTLVTSPAATSGAASAAAAPASVPAAIASSEPPAAAQKASPAPALSPVAAAVAATTEKPAAAIGNAEPGPAPAPPMTQATPNAQAPAAALIALKSMMAPPDPAAGKLIEPSPSPRIVTAAPIPDIMASGQSAQDVEEADAEVTAPKLAVQRTEFGVDVGGANSIPGLRALWRGLLKSRSNAALTALRPIIVIKEGNNGLGMQLRLVAGPISDAAAAARICAAIIENARPCATTVFEGQRLAVKTDEPVATEVKPAAAAKPTLQKRYLSKRAEPQAQQPEPSTLSWVFGRTNR